MLNSKIVLTAVSAVIAASAWLPPAVARTTPDASTATPTHALLPDLDQAALRSFALDRTGPRGHRRFHLGFDSAAANVGDGPLLVHGVRLGRVEPTMRADQLVEYSDGAERLTTGIGEIHFVKLHDHQHWHYLDFERYELRDDKTLGLIEHDQKTGFCLGDRYRSHPRTRLVNRAPRAVYGNACALHQPEIQGIFEGLSPGWGDLYKAILEGQSLDITAVPAGTYQLVNRVNPEGRLIERSTSNNGASERIRITWPHGHASYPSVYLLAACPDSYACHGSWSGPTPTFPDVPAGLPGGALIPKTTTPGGAP